MSGAGAIRGQRGMTGPALLRIIGIGAIVLAVGVMGILLAPGSAEAPSDAERESSATLAAFLASMDQPAGPPLSGPWELNLPRDFGAHPDARSETWSVTAHLEDPQGRPLAVSMILMRLGTASGDTAEAQPFGPGPIHVGQVVVTSSVPDLRVADDRASRMPGTAGHDPGRREIWLDDWVLTYGDAGLELDLRLQDRTLQLTLEALKPPLTADGTTGEATRGFAIPNLAVTGSLGTGARQVALSGTAWLDRLWGDVPLPGGPLSRDRLVLHLSDGADVTLVRTRRRDGRGIATIEGVLVEETGTATVVADEAVEVTPVFAQVDDAVPISWRIAGAGLNLEARVIDTSRQDGFGQPATMSLVEVTGTRAGQNVDGTGTLFLSSDDLS
jgi:predicted secreted hydrolase